MEWGFPSDVCRIEEERRSVTWPGPDSGGQGSRHVSDVSHLPWLQQGIGIRYALV